MGGGGKKHKFVTKKFPCDETLHAKYVTGDASIRLFAIFILSTNLRPIVIEKIGLRKTWWFKVFYKADSFKEKLLTVVDAP